MCWGNGFAISAQTSSPEPQSHLPHLASNPNGNLSTFRTKCQQCENCIHVMVPYRRTNNHCSHFLISVNALILGDVSMQQCCFVYCLYPCFLYVKTINTTSFVLNWITLTLPHEFDGHFNCATTYAHSCNKAIFFKYHMTSIITTAAAITCVCGCLY